MATSAHNTPHFSRTTTVKTYLAAVFLISVFNAGLMAEEPPNKQLGIHKVGSWHAASNTQLVIEDHQHNQYLAILKSPCNGLESAKSIAFTNHSSNTLNKHSTVILPNGTRCPFKSFIQKPTILEQ